MKIHDWQRILLIQGVLILSGLLLAMLGYLASLFRQTLTVFVLAVLLALVLHPVVQMLERNRLQRWIAILIVYLFALLLFVLAILFLYQPAVDQLNALILALPGYATVWEQQSLELQRTIDSYGIPFHLPDIGQQILEQLRRSGLTLLSNTFGIIGTISTIITETILIIVLSVYLLIDYPRMTRAVNRLPEDRRAFIKEAAYTTNRVFGRYVRGQLLLGVVLGLCVWLGMVILNMPYAVLLGVVAGVFELIPMFGAILGALPALAIAAFMPWPQLLIVGLFFVVLQQIEGNVLAPRITGHAVGLRPAATLLALIAGFEVAGLWGGIFAVPVVAIFYSLYIGLTEARRSQASAAASPETPSRAARSGGFLKRILRKTR